MKEPGEEKKEEAKSEPIKDKLIAAFGLKGKAK